MRTTRRDFLAGLGAGALVAGFPFAARPAVASALRFERAPEGAAVAKVRIYPAIGISRVGGSPEWFLAPEAPGVAPRPDGGFKDGTEALKKQAQRFRVYAFDAEDRVVGEVAGEAAAVTWRVHLANTKAAWYGFNNPLDNGALAPGLPGRRRNPGIVDPAERERLLLIDGGAVEIAGASRNADGDDPAFAFTGRFLERVDVGLGHLRTDGEGRLLVIPPDGRSASPAGAPITSFADNDGWHDDWCDGPVTATVRLADGRTLEAEPAWVACVGPNFAPEIDPVTTLFDVIADLNVAEGWTAAPTAPLSFTRDIYPTFRRVALMAWVSSAAHLREGWLTQADFDDPDFVRRLADPSPANAAFRQTVFANFRDPDATGPDAYLEQRLRIPYMLGDGVNYPGSPLQWFQFPKLQYAALEAFAAGAFVADFDALGPTPVAFDALPLEDQPGALTQAALEACSGGAFHPGVELSYYLRRAPMYARHTDPAAEPFRLAHGGRPGLAQDLGLLLTPEVAERGHDGVPPPIGPQMPGDLTRWMGLPWQCDAFSCQQVQTADDFPQVVWWPAQLPVDVLPEAFYEQIMRADLPPETRTRFFDSRLWWARGVAGVGYHANAGYMDGITAMIALWERMGFVVARPGPTDPGRPPEIPSTLYVEVGRGSVEKRLEPTPRGGVTPY